VGKKERKKERGFYAVRLTRKKGGKKEQTVRGRKDVSSHPYIGAIKK